MLQRVSSIDCEVYLFEKNSFLSFTSSINKQQAGLRFQTGWFWPEAEKEKKKSVPILFLFLALRL